MMNLEKHKDKFNIDFIRYFSRDRFLINLVTSVIVTAVWVRWQWLWDVSLSFSFETLVTVVLIGAASYFIGLAAICYSAGNWLEESMRLAGRRGLFSFATMTNVILLMLIISGNLSWQDPFSKTLTLLFTGQILCGIAACGLDLLIPLIKSRIRR